MFEKYTERARRVIFFARYEASQFGSVMIETEHLLLGLLREDTNLANRFVRDPSSSASIRNDIEARIPIRAKVSTSIDLPLSNECRRILAYAAEEAERLNHPHIGTDHLLLGMLREEKCTAAQVLSERGMKLNVIREQVARSPMPPEPEGMSHGQRFPFPFLHNPSLPKSGVVPDADTAKRIAEAVWTPLYSADTIATQAPVRAELQGNVWIVTGSSAPGTALFAFILQIDGRILSVGRGNSGSDV